MPNLSDLAIRALKTPNRERLIADGNGLYLRARANSPQKTWIFRYTKFKKTKKLQIGSYPAVSLSEARQMALELAREHSLGLDPSLERQKRKAEEKARNLDAQRHANRETVAGLFERWVQIELSSRKDGGAEIRRAFNKDVLPRIGSVCIEDLTKAEILRVVDPILGRQSVRMAKIVFALLRQMLSFAVDRGVIASDPTAGIKKSKIGGKTVERERVLCAEEIAALPDCLARSGLKTESQLAVWIVLSTGCRIGELLKAKWSDVDLTQGVWRIPEQNSKNGKPHTIWLSQFAIQQFIRLKACRTKVQDVVPLASIGSSWLYANRPGTGPINVKTISKQIGDRQKTVTNILSKRANEKTCSTLYLGTGKWGMHDLRRTSATLMVANGVLPEVAERCLNHTEQNRLKRIYQRHSYQKEMKAAWDTLGNYLSELINKDIRDLNHLKQAERSVA